MSEPREKIADLVDAISRNEVSEPTDAVLRVLAEHGDMGQVREELADLRHNLAERAFTAPDADDATMLASLDARIRDALAGRDAAVEQLERLHSWGGLLELLDEHWPTDIFPVPEDIDAAKVTDRRDTGPIILSLIRWVDRLSADLAAARQQLDQVRELCRSGPFITPEEVLVILDAPARPAGHDETGQ